VRWFSCPDGTGAHVPCHVPEVTDRDHDFRHGAWGATDLYFGRMDASSIGLRWAGMVAWGAAGLPVVLAANDRGLHPRIAAALAAFVVFGAAFWWASAPRERTSARRLRTGLAVQLLAAVAAAFAVPVTSTFVLAVIVATQLPPAFSLRTCIGIVLAQTFVIAAAYRAAPPAMIATLAGIYGGFQFFGLFTAWIMEREQRARLELAAAHAQLLSTRELLADRVRRSERDRLAGDLHDLLGHDLVALRVNLEAARLHEGDVARGHLDQAHELAGRMLTDVRDLVRATRRTEVDLPAALRELARGVPRPHVELDIEEPLGLADPDVAEVALRCAQEALTNAMRHSDASRLRIAVRREPHALVVTAQDDGRGAGPGFVFGSGLEGMQRRAARLGGKVTAGDVPEGGFRVVLEVPVRKEPV